MLAAHTCLCGSTNYKGPCALLIVINYTLLSHYLVLIVLVLITLPLAVATVDQEQWLLILPPTHTLFVCGGKYSSLRTGSYRAVRRVAYATRVVLDSPPPRDGLGISREDLSLRSFVP